MMSEELTRLLEISSIEDFQQSEQVELIGSLFDLSIDNQSIQGIEHGLKLAEQIKVFQLKDELYTTVQYFLANGWSGSRHLKYSKTAEGWNFNIDELTKEIFYLRKAIASPGFEKVQKERQCQILTNLGNTFSYIGRYIEAQEYWNRAIATISIFPMATGNKANGLFFYGRILYDEIHKGLFFIYAYHYLRDTLAAGKYLDPYALDDMQQLYKYLDSQISNQYKSELPDLNSHGLGDDQALADYRQWCLEHMLFINPLNDLGTLSIASHDCLNLPTLIIEAKRPPVYLNLFNQIKQEFATARFAYYQSTLGNSTHLSDIDVVLVETLETVRHSYYIEQLKIAFRIAYSILDKIAFLLNDYLQLQIPENKVSFRTLWYSNLQKSVLREFFTQSNNWSLRGLYWLSKDLYDKENDFDSVLEPDSKEIAAIRNHIEHKGFKVVSDIGVSPFIEQEREISFTISRDDFEKKAMKLLKLTRAAIMYVALAISHEEQKKDHSGLKTLPINLGVVPDYMKT